MKMHARLEKLESAVARFDEIAQKLDKIIELCSNREQSEHSDELLEGINTIRQRLGC